MMSIKISETEFTCNYCQVSELDAVVIPVGGGGLIAGTATAIKVRHSALMMSIIIVNLVISIYPHHFLST